MIINIPTITVDGDTCSQARVSCAVSDSVAIRVVPIDHNGKERPEATQGIVGGRDDQAIAAFLDGLTVAIENLVEIRGI